MVKSREEEVLHMFRCLFVDIGNTYPDLRDEFGKDYQTLVVLMAERGLHLACIDLPGVGKHLDRCVSEGFWSLSGLPLTKRCPKRIMYPEFLSGLWGKVFHEDGRLKEDDCDVEALLLLRQVYYLAKKLELSCPHECVLQEVQDFMEIDRDLPAPEEEWYQTASISGAYEGFAKSTRYQARLDGRPLAGELNVFLRNLDKIAGFLNSALGSYDPMEWRFKHGPGVVSERKGCVNKYEFVNWSDMLESVFGYADFGFHNHQGWSRQFLYHMNAQPKNCEVPAAGSENPVSRMVAVHKTLTKPRLIAAEPSEHMWCQQNLWAYMKSRVKSSWIANFVRFTDQSRNQALCKAASVTGALATLDLSSASDRVSCHFVGQLFRSNPRLLEALRASRTQVLGQNLNADVEGLRRLNKFSTMGSACTFPVETLGFTCIALAACLTRRKQLVTSRNIEALKEEVTIFGDDIIVPSDCRELVCEALEVLDFKINAGKSYWNGKFRESCGVDAYRGVDITPVYWCALAASDPDSVVGTVEVRNSFYKKGYWTVAEYLTSTIPRQGLPTVRTDSGVLGLAAFSGARLAGLKRRINVHLQRDEVFCLGISARQKIREPRGESVLLQYFTEKPELSTPWRGGVAQKPVSRLDMGWYETMEVVS